MLQAKNLTVAIGAKVVCRDLNILIKPGQCWGVLGQNGVGKTTLLRTLAGLHVPLLGGVSWNDIALGTHERRDLARQLAVLLQNEGGEFWGSVLEYVLMGRFPHRTSLFGYSPQDEVIAQQALMQMDLALLAQRPLNSLSGGERQRAAIAQVLAQQAHCYVLDEPLQHLDIRHQTQTIRILADLKEQGKALVIALHDLLWAQRCCDHVLLLFADGQMRYGPAQELLTHTHLEALFQCPLHVSVVEGERYYAPSV